MRILIAADSFKDALPASAVCAAIELGLRQRFPTAELQAFPLADGGEGTCDVLCRHLQLERVQVDALDPLFRSVQANIGVSTDKSFAAVELASVSGLQLLNAVERNPLHTTSLGTGQLIAAAITKGAREILLGIGGSATNDAGIGIAAALGWQFLDINGCEVAPIGQSLLDIRRIVCPQINVSSQIKVLCDVHNPLFGNNGAAHVYGKQKGASNADIATLDAGLRHIAKLIAELQLSAISPETPGAGAAGGVGFGAMVFLGAKLYSGIDYLLDLTGFDAALVKADLIVTGEGRLDGQTLQGKLIRGLCRRAAQKNIPVIALCGQVSASEKEIRELGLRAAYCINDADVSTAEALPHTAERLTAAAARLIY